MLMERIKLDAGEGGLNWWTGRHLVRERWKTHFSQDYREGLKLEGCTKEYQMQRSYKVIYDELPNGFGYKNSIESLNACHRSVGILVEKGKLKEISGKGKTSIDKSRHVAIKKNGY